MSIVNIRDISLDKNPARFDDDYNFTIKFEAMAPLAEDLDWRLIYVGSADTEEFDQELDSCQVGPVPAGVNAFEFSAPAPQRHLLPSTTNEDVLGVTVIILTASYREKEFVRVGYYVNTYYEDPGMQEDPPAEVVWDKLMRSVLIEKPKVTRFQNPWDSGVSNGAFEGQPTEIQEVGGASGMNYMLDAAVPPPVTKAAQQSDTSAVGSNGMEVDSPMVA